jgi:hypothetical protein
MAKKSLHLSDLGLNATLIKNYHEGSMHGRWHYALQAFKTLINTDIDFFATISNKRAYADIKQMIVI